jgi:cytochrome c2
MVKTVSVSMGIIGIILMILVSVMLSVVPSSVFTEENLSYGCGITSTQELRDNLNTIATKGEILFKNNCAPCHSVHHTVVGPALARITERQSKIQIRKWIRNSQKLILVEKNKYAIDLYEKYNRTIMTSFPTMTNKEIDEILEYIKDSPFPKPLPAMPQVISCP